MSTDTAKMPPWEKYDVSRSEWENMTPDERRKVRYDHWYEKNRERRNKMRREKYHNDPAHRKKVLDGCKRRRPRLRREKAKEKFERKLHAAKERELEQCDTEDGGGRKGLPRFVSVNGTEMWVYTSRKLALSCGRGQSTVRAWIAQGVLPGCTINIKGRYYFSDAFIKAVRQACRKVYLYDGNGSREVLFDLIRKELSKAGCSYVPPDGTENDRIHPQAA